MKNLITKFCLSLVAAGTLASMPLPHALAQSRPSSNGFNLPSIGDGEGISLGEERRLGDQIISSIYKDPDYLDDPALSAYVNAIWTPLRLAAQERGDITPEMAERLAWTLVLNREPSINAFALPGGYMGVNLGLLATVDSADELASVLAHETSHISQRHIARMVDKQGKDTPMVVAAMILGALAASKAGNADIASAAIVGGQAVVAQKQLNFSRDMEREADRVGFGVMTESGFDGSGFVTMFDKLQKASRLNDDGSFPYLRSHPLTTERIADMRARVPVHTEHHIANAVGVNGLTPQYHALMSARARVLADTNVDHWRVLMQPSHKQGNDLLGARYAATLAAAKLRDPAAMRHWQVLQATPVSDANASQAIQWLRLEVLLELHGSESMRDPSMQSTLQTLGAEALASGAREGVMLGAQFALRADDATQRNTIGRLQSWTAQNPRDALAWQSLSSLHNAQQQPVLAARAEAESRVAQLDLPGALDRFHSAQRLAQQAAKPDHIEMSILDARVRQVQSSLNEQNDAKGEI